MAFNLTIERILEEMVNQEQDEKVRVVNVRPYIESDEQHYEVKYTSEWLECGYDITSFSISEILCFSLTHSFK